MKLIPITRKTHQAGLLRLAAGCLLLGLTAAMLASGAARADDGSCDGEIPLQKQKFGGPKGDTNSQPNLKIDKPCWIDIAGTYVYGNINIIGPNGSLEFRDPAAKGSQVNFWAKNIIVENGGTLKAGTATAPYGSRGGVLTIYLYGADQTKGLDPNSEAGQAQGVPAGPTRATRLGSGLAASRPRRQAARISMAPGATTVKLPSRSTPTRRMTFSTSMAPCPGTRGVPTRTPSRTTRPPRCSGRSTMEFGPAPIRNSKPAISATRSWPCPMAAPFSSSATRARRCPRRRPPPPTRRFRFFGNQGTFNPQGAMGAPSQFASQSAPGLRGRGHLEVSSSSGSMVISATAAGQRRRGAPSLRPIHRFGYDGILWRRGRRRRFGW